MKKRRNENIEAVELMRKIRDLIAEEEAGLSWEQRKSKLRKDLEQSSFWNRLEAAATSDASPKAALRKQHRQE